MKVVEPKSVEGWNLTVLQMFGVCGPKMTIQCGGCGCVFRKRIHAGVENEVVPCSHCGAGNQLHFTWESGETK